MRIVVFSNGQKFMGKHQESKKEDLNEISNAFSDIIVDGISVYKLELDCGGFLLMPPEAFNLAVFVIED